MLATARQLTITTTAVTAALLLTACASTEPRPKPLEHGTVKKKVHDEATRTPIYENRYRETNCRKVTTNALTLTGISRPTTGGSGGRTTTGGSGGGGVSKVKPGTPNNRNKDNSSGSSGESSGGGGTRRVCDHQYLGRELTGWHRTPEAWKVLIVKGERSRWKHVTEDKWRTIKIGDSI
ncbi:hypothetical protein [Streptomyces tendae]|uniref:hypothetical protein n=1 Tax=Streptomyces tendae TaxID=1932 RepID=UPI0036B8DA42